MFVFIFPPAATGWHTFEDTGLLPDEPAVRLDGGWPHTEARLQQGVTRAGQTNRWHSLARQHAGERQTKGERDAHRSIVASIRGLDDLFATPVRFRPALLTGRLGQ